MSVSADEQILVISSSTPVHVCFVTTSSEQRDDFNREGDCLVLRGDWYVVMLPDNKNEIKVQLSENLTGKIRSLEIFADYHGKGDSATITQQP